MNLKDKNVLITGATGGIGKSLVEKFYNFGAKIIATGTRDDKLNKLKEEFPKIWIVGENCNFRRLNPSF